MAAVLEAREELAVVLVVAVAGYYLSAVFAGQVSEYHGMIPTPLPAP